MDFLYWLWDYVVPFLFILTVLVFVHELGHYLVARWNQVRVEVFSIGFGPEIYGWTDSVNTRWKICAIPLGGYVKMFGEDEAWEEDGKERELTPEELAVSFPKKRLGQRSAIVAAGPIANFIFAIVILTGLYLIVGNPVPLSGVGSVKPGSPAEAAGIKPGDRFLAINGEEIKLFEDLQRIIGAHADVSLSILILRDGSELTVSATPRSHKMLDENGLEVEIGLLGVTPDPEQIEFEPLGVFESTLMASEKSFALATQIMSALGEMISGDRTAEELGGPLRIAQISGEMAQGGLINLVFFLAALSVNLGLINLFPIPMLDGGHLVFYMAEFVLGRPIPPMIQEYSFRFGLILVLLLMVFATWNDLVHLKVFEFIKDLVT